MAGSVGALRQRGAELVAVWNHCEMLGVVEKLGEMKKRKRRVRQRCGTPVFFFYDIPLHHPLKSRPNKRDI